MKDYRQSNATLMLTSSLAKCPFLSHMYNPYTREYHTLCIVSKATHCVVTCAINTGHYTCVFTESSYTINGYSVKLVF